MSWESDLVIMLRTEIGDLDSTTYSDSRLKEVIVYAAYNVYQSASFASTYTIDISDKTISPDPYDIGDFDFCVLSVYKAACTILTGEVKTNASKAVVIKDGPSFVDFRGPTTALSDLMKAACQTYKDLLFNYQLTGPSNGETTAVGQAVLTPYAPGSFLMNWTRNSVVNYIKKHYSAPMSVSYTHLTLPTICSV